MDMRDFSFSRIATDNIDYVATHNDGLGATSTRRVIIGAASATSSTA
jgi:hypothetical protein